MKENKSVKEKVMHMNKQGNIRKYIRPIIVKRNQINKVCLRRIIRQRYTDIIVLGRQNAKQIKDILSELGIETVIAVIDNEETSKAESIRKSEMLDYRIVITSRKRRHGKKN